MEQMKLVRPQKQGNFPRTGFDRISHLDEYSTGGLSVLGTTHGRITPQWKNPEKKHQLTQIGHGPVRNGPRRGHLRRTNPVSCRSDCSAKCCNNKKNVGFTQTPDNKQPLNE